MPLNNEPTPTTRNSLLAALRFDAKQAVMLLRQNGVEEKILNGYNSARIDFVFSEHAHLEDHKKYGRLDYMDIEPQIITQLVIGISKLLEKVNANDVAINLLQKTLNKELLNPLYHEKYASFFKIKTCAKELEKLYWHLVNKQTPKVNHRFHL